MSQKGGIWRFSGVLRGLAIFLAILCGVLYLYTWGAALAGDTELAFDFADVYSTAPLDAWQIIGGIICSGIAIAAVIMICLAAARFLSVTKRDGFFIVGAAKACRRMGQGLIVFWVGMVLVENFMPWIMTRNFAVDERIEIEWFLLDLSFIFLLLGVVLLLMAGAMDQARVIDQDNKQII